MKLNISIFLISLILFTGCGDNEDSLSNDIDFFSNHISSVWVTSSFWWLRINNDSSDEYHAGECVKFPVADGIYNDWEGYQFNQTIIRNEANFVSWKIDYIKDDSYPDGIASYSVDKSGNKLTYKTTSGAEFVYTKVNDTFPGTDCKN
tara:strand:- start:1059 stop:1502 length:444 start_codon:yes stop_codon:yes gene_type:complete